MKNKIKKKQIKKNKQTKTSTNTTIFFSLKPGVRPCLYNVERGPTQPSVSPVHSKAGHFQKYTLQLTVKAGYSQALKAA